ncbi:MAG: hypothetical protein KGD58_16045 [Candidatus Lokiarchaeota archaeon]|nr:hypothetical protein [Candidatus Lokiarchaeota archaeon]
MEVQIGKMILYGALSALFYIVVPLVLFEVLQVYNIMTFSAAFKTAIIIFGIIGVVISMARHLFPKDTPANRLVAFGAVIYSGIYLFYMFGGFTPGVALGTYRIDLPMIQVLLGLQLIAWLLLASSGIRALQYLVEALELRNKKEYNVNMRKQFKLSMLFKIFGTIMGLGIAGYFGSLVYSGMNLGFDVHDTFYPNYDWKGTPSTADDTFNITMTFDVDNQGIYAIYDLTMNFYIYNASADPSVKIGESLNSDYGTIHSFSSQPNNNITVDIDNSFLAALNASAATLEFKISFSTLYAGIFIDLNISFEVPWTP